MPINEVALAIGRGTIDGATMPVNALFAYRVRPGARILFRPSDARGRCRRLYLGGLPARSRPAEGEASLRLVK
jgi:hypothetical protein